MPPKVARNRTDFGFIVKTSAPPALTARQGAPYPCYADLGGGMIDRRAMLAATAAAFAAAAALAGPAEAGPAGDLTGTWTNAWYTKLQRPKAFKGLVATPAEALAYETPRRAHAGELISPKDELGQNESEFPDNGPGLARVRGEIRSSWIVEPANGRIPWTAEARKRLHLDDDNAPDLYDNVEDRDTDERCLTADGDGAPLINSHDANLMQIVQTGDAVVIVSEKNHQTRIVHVGGPPTADPGGQFGTSQGHWEGATLVVETQGLPPGLTKISDELSLSEHAQVTERFTRTGPREITYLFTVSDPTLFTQAWRGEMVFRAAEGRLFEYACHEGNYSLPSILTAARMGRQGKPASAQTAAAPTAAAAAPKPAN
jgi:hypothetical protein